MIEIQIVNPHGDGAAADEGRVILADKDHGALLKQEDCHADITRARRWEWLLTWSANRCEDLLFDLALDPKVQRITVVT